MIGQLVRIDVTHIKISMTHTPAKLEMIPDDSPSYNMSRESGGPEYEREPGKLSMDSYEMRRSLGFSNNTDLLADAAQEGINNVAQVMKRTGEEANMMLNVGMKSSPKNVMSQIAKQRMAKNYSTVTTFLPSTPTKIQYDPEKLATAYKRDQLNFQWNTNTRKHFEYTPATLSFEVTQYPKIEFTYIGDIPGVKTDDASSKEAN